MLPSHRQRLSRRNAPLEASPASEEHPPPSRRYPPGGARRSRSRNQQEQQQCSFFCIPSDRVLVSVGVALGILVWMAASVLVHLLLVSKSQRSFTNIHFSFPHPIGAITNTTTARWNPELQFVHKVYRHDRHDRRHRRPTNNTIFVVGLPKAGTSSLFAYFTCLGFYSQHWFCCGPQRRAQQEDMTAYMSDCMISNLQDHLPILDGCGDYDVYTELNGPRRKTKFDQDSVLGPDGMIGYRPRIFLPQRYHLPELHEYAPDATWIVNVRPLEDWLHSVLQVPANMLAKQILFEAQFQDPERWWPQPQPQQRPNKAFLAQFWKDHIQYVTDFAAAHPSHNLIWVNITDPNAGVKLAQDLINGGNTYFPILQDRHHPHHDDPTQNRSSSRKNNLQTPPQTLDDISRTRLLSRAKACWGAHNVKQHGDYS